MRFIIIPLLLIGYLFWSYISIKDTIYCKKNNVSIDNTTTIWWMFKILIFIGITIIYW